MSGDGPQAGALALRGWSTEVSDSARRAVRAASEAFTEVSGSRGGQSGTAPRSTGTSG